MDLVLHCEYLLETGQATNDPDNVQIICVDASGQTQTSRFSVEGSQFLWECLRTTAMSDLGVERTVRSFDPLSCEARSQVPTSNFSRARVFDGLQRLFAREQRRSVGIGERGQRGSSLLLQVDCSSRFDRRQQSSGAAATCICQG